jgi:hypothetical protein
MGTSGTVALTKAALAAGTHGAPRFRDVVLGVGIFPLAAIDNGRDFLA